MIKITDKYSFAVFASLIANIPINILDFIIYKLGINKYLMWHIAASAYFKKSDVHTIPALITGAATDYITAGLMGVPIFYLLYWTGKDYFWLKGISIGGFWWLTAFGVILRCKVARIDPVDASTNLYHLSEHILLGFLTALIIVKYGSDLLASSPNS